MQLFTNNAATRLVTGISNSALTLQVTAGTGALFPNPTGSDYFLVTLSKISGGIESDIEIVKVTQRVTDVFTIVRAQEGTTALAYVVDDHVQLRTTATTYSSLETHVNNTSNPHSTTKAQVGLGNVDNTADTAKPISTATQTALDLKAPIASPTFTGTVSGVTKAMVGLGSVDNTADADKPVSTAQAAADSAVQSAAASDATTKANAAAAASAPIAHVGAGGSSHADVVAAGASGFMTGADKTKLDGIATGANLYVHPTGDGNLHVPATSTTNDGKVLTAGATAGSLSWTVPLALASTTPAALAASAAVGVGTTAAKADHVHPLPTYTDVGAAPSSHPGTGGSAHALVIAGGASGFMSGADKTKLDGLTGNYTLPVASTTVLGGVKQGTNTSIDVNGVISASNVNIGQGTNTSTAVLLTSSTGTGTTLAAATTSIAGVMTAADKTKLDGISSGAGIGQALTGFVSGAGTVTAADTVLTAFNKHDGNINAKLATASFTDAAVTGKVLTGFVSGAGTVAATDTILAAVNKLDGNIAAKSPLAGSASITTVGTIATGTWNATAIADGKIASALTGKSYNGLTLTANATGWAIAGGTTSKTFTVSNTLTLAGTDSSTLNIGTGGTLGSNAFTSTAYAPIASPTFTGTVTLPSGTVISGRVVPTGAAITAAGTTQGTATALTNDLNNVTTSTAGTGLGVVLPTAAAGKSIVVMNKSANAINLYPASGGTIDALAANAALSIPVSGFVELVGTSATQWYSTANAILNSTALQGTLSVAQGGTGAATLTGLVKGTGTTAMVAAVSGTDYQAPIGTISGVVKGNGANALTAAVAGTDYVVPSGAIGTPSSGNLSNCTADGTNPVGYLNIPQNSKSIAYTLVLADAGKHILHPSADTTARTFTIPANASVAYPIGTAITFVNQVSAGVLTIAITTDTMRLAGAGTTGSRSLAASGVATAIKITATEWIISGTGLT